METMSHILEFCTIAQLGVLVRHHYADDYVVTWLQNVAAKALANYHH